MCKKRNEQVHNVYSNGSFLWMGPWPVSTGTSRKKIQNLLRTKIHFFYYCTSPNENDYQYLPGWLLVSTFSFPPSYSPCKEPITLFSARCNRTYNVKKMRRDTWQDPEPRNYNWSGSEPHPTFCTCLKPLNEYRYRTGTYLWRNENYRTGTTYKSFIFFCTQCFRSGLDPN